MFDKIRTILLHPLRSIRNPGSIIYPHNWNNDAYVNFLRERGAEIGPNTRFINPMRCGVDYNRAEYISIGKNCCLSEVSILAHDYSWYTLLGSKNDILPDSGGRVVIGDNCFIGFQSLILKDTTIGDNVIIGARSVVKGDVPSNTVWAGVPARQLCTIDDFYKKRESKRLEDAIIRRNFVKCKKGRNATIHEMGMFAVLFLQRTEDNYDKYIKQIDFNGIKDSPMVRNYFFNSKPFFKSFEEFIDYRLEK